MRLASQIAALCLAAITAPACARSFTTADLLAAEEFGQMAFTPDGKRLIFERLVPFTQGGPFEYDTYPPLRRGRIYVVDVARPGLPRLLVAATPGEGHTAGPISPSGRAMVVLRLKGRTWEAGVVGLATGEVRWLGVTPELAQLGQTIAWRSDDQLVIAVREDIPLRLRAGWQAHEALQSRWKAAAKGEPALSEVGAGAYAGGADPPPGGALMLIDLTSGERRVLARGDFYDLAIAPDGRQVAAMANLEALAPGPQPRTVATPNRRRNLILVDLMSKGATTPCPDCDLSPHLIAWSADARQVLVHGRRKGLAWSGLLAVSEAGSRQVPTGDFTLALDRTSEGHIIAPAGWLSGEPIALATPPGGRADWFSFGPEGPVNLTAALPEPPDRRLLAQAAGAIVVTSAGAVWRIDPRGSTRLTWGASPLSAQGFSLSSRERQNPAANLGWFTTPTSAGPQLVATTGKAAPGEVGDGALAQAVARTARAEVRADDRGGLELVLFAPRPRVVMSLNHQLADVEFAKIHVIEAQSSNGQPLRHYLLLPRHPRGPRSPLIVVPYPGLPAALPRAYSGGTGRFPANAELMAAAGYAVLIPSLPRDRRTEPGAGLANQILAAVDLAETKVGGFDAARPILWGQSFGGYAALMAATQSERFSAVIASAAVSNLASARGVFDPHGEARPSDGLSAYMIGWSEAGQGGLGVSPWEAPGLYVRNSPVFLAGRIKAPVLLIHGDLDFVRLGQAQEMFSALARQAKDVTLITAYGEGHIVSTPGNLQAIYARAFSWLDQRLGERAKP